MLVTHQDTSENRETPENVESERDSKETESENVENVRETYLENVGNVGKPIWKPFGKPFRETTKTFIKISNNPFRLTTRKRFTT